MRNLGKNPTEEQLAEMIADIDADNNGSIGLAEFCTLFAQAGGDEPEEPLQQPAPSQTSQPGSPPKSPKKQSTSNTAAAATARRLKAVGCTPLMPGEVDLVYQRCTAGSIFVCKAFSILDFGRILGRQWHTHWADCRGRQT